MKAPAGLLKLARLAPAQRAGLVMPAVAILVLVLVLGGGNFLWQLYVSVQHEAREARLDSVVDAYLAELGDPLRSYMDRVDAALRAADPASAAASGDDAALRGALDRMSAALSDAIGVRFIPAGQREVDYSTRPPVSFATLDLIRESRTGSEPPAEVHLYDTEYEHLALLRRLESATGDLLGHVLVGYSVEPLRQALVGVPLAEGYAELVQRVPGSRPVRIAARGDESLLGQVARGSRVLGGSRLQVLVRTADPGTGRLAGLGDLVTVVVGAVLLVAGLGTAALGALRRRREARGKVLLAGAVSDERRPAAAVETVPAPRVVDAQDIPPPPSPLDGIEVETLEDGYEAGEPAAAAQNADDLGLEFDEIEAVDEAPAAAAAGGLASAIFRAYDIRGVVGEGLDADTVRRIGRAIGTEAFERGQQTVVVGRDGRLSSDELCAALIEGLTSTGRDVVDIGRVPTPVLYFATYFLNTGSGVMVTGSHNPPQYNGLKIMLGGETLFGDAIQALAERVRAADFRDGSGQVQTMDLMADYIRRITEDMPVALGSALRIVVDCGNGAASEVAPKLLRALGHDVVELHCRMDGNFPNHHPDPSQPENLQDLIDAVKRERADLGLAFDGDGDRIGVVDDRGSIIWPDRLMMIFARDVLQESGGGPVVFDVKCSSRLREVIEQNGGEPVMDKTGHSFMRNKLNETGAELAGELSGHIFFKDRWYGFDDGMYVAARLLEILLNERKRPSRLFAEVPSGVVTPELRIDLLEGEEVALMEDLRAAASFDDATVYDLDGLRVEFADGWGLVRASNTTPSLSLRFEGDDEQALERVQGRFRELIAGVRPELELPF